MKRKCTIIPLSNKRSARPARAVWAHYVSFQKWKALCLLRRARERVQRHLLVGAVVRLQSRYRGWHTRRMITRRLQTSRIVEEPDQVQTRILQHLNHASLHVLRQCNRRLARTNTMKIVASFHQKLRQQINEVLDQGGVPSDGHHAFLQDCALEGSDHQTVYESFKRRTMCRHATPEDRAWIMNRMIRGDHADPGVFRRTLEKFTLVSFKRANRYGTIPKNLDDLTAARGGNVLHHAIKNRKFSFMRYLILQCGMDPNVKFTSLDSYGSTTLIGLTPLHCAVVKGDVRTVTFLVDQGGADVHATVGRFYRFPKGANALDMALHISIRAPIAKRIYEILKDAGAHHTNMRGLRHF